MPEQFFTIRKDRGKKEDIGKKRKGKEKKGKNQGPEKKRLRTEKKRKEMRKVGVQSETSSGPFIDLKSS